MDAGRVGVGDLGLVAAHADEAQGGGGGDRVGDGAAVVVAAGPGTGSSLGAELDDDVDAHRPALQGPAHELDPAHGVDVADEAEAGVGGELVGDPAQGGGVDELVGEEDPLDAEGAVDAGLVGYGGGDAPRAVLQLAAEELRGHAGLAVRGEGEVVAGGVGAEGGEVVLQRVRVEGQDGGGEPAAVQVPPLGGELPDGEAAGLGVRGQSLEPVVDRLVGEVLDGVAGHAVPPGLRGVQRSLRMPLRAV